MIEKSQRRNAAISICVAIIAAGVLAWSDPFETISGSPIEHPRLLQFALVVYCAAYSIVLIVSFFSKNIRPSWLGPAIFSVWTIFGVIGCNASQHRTPASVQVITSWGHYDRRPPGMKRYDDRMNDKSFWFRALLVGTWIAGAIIRADLESRNRNVSGSATVRRGRYLP